MYWPFLPHVSTKVFLHDLILLQIRLLGDPGRGVHARLVVDGVDTHLWSVVLVFRLSDSLVAIESACVLAVPMCIEYKQAFW